MKHDAPGKHPRSTHSTHLDALGGLVEQAFPAPEGLFCHGLELLARQLKADLALLTRLGEEGPEPLYWATLEGTPPGDAVQHPELGFSQGVLHRPTRTLVIRDTARDPQWREHPGHRRLGIRAFVGVTLRQGELTTGTLEVHSSRPRAFSRPEIAMVKAMADLFGKTLEVESLKHELRLTQDALDLTAAVVEDSALEAPSGLPNRRYLDIWLRANLHLARRRQEAMSVVRFDLPLTRELRRHLLEVAEALRGEDLLVDLGRDRFLLLLPRTPREGADILLGRVQDRIGEIPMGATLWDPHTAADQGDLTAHQAQKRAQQALDRATDPGAYWI